MTAFLLCALPGLFPVGASGQSPGELRFEPAEPAAGATVRAVYRPAPELADEARLHLRARFRTRRDGSYNGGMEQVVAGALELREDGAFSGTFRLPDSVVYAAFAVEDPEGAAVDHNGRRLWEVLVHGADGRPLFAALEQRSNDLMGRNWEEAHATVERLAELYPDEPDAWSSLRFFQAQVLGPEAMEEALAVHRERLEAFHAERWPRDDLSGDELARMMWYARGVDDTLKERAWRTRLLEEAPTQTHALQERIVFEIMPDLRGDDARILEAMDALWAGVEAGAGTGQGGPGFGHLLRFGFGAAVALGDPAAIRRWRARYLEVYLDAGASLARRLVSHPEFREEALATLRREVARLASAPDDDRRLTRTVGEHRRALEAPLRRALSTLADGLLAASDSAAARDALGRAAETGWDTDVFRRLAELRAAAGDSAGAVQMWARVAVDPATGDALADSVRAATGAARDADRWEALTDAAAGEMGRRVLAGATLRSLGREVRLAGAGGGVESLRELADGKVTLVVFWSRSCGAAVQALPELDRVAGELEARGARVVTVVDEPLSGEVTGFLAERDVSLPLYHDLHRDATQAFNQWGTPEYFLLDGEGRIRFEYSELAEVPRQAEVLLRARPAM